MKLAVFLPNWIGDVVMATPALRAIRDQFPSAKIVGIMRPYVADVLDGTTLIDQPLFYNPRGKDVRQRGWRFVRALRAEQFDTAVLLTNSLRTASLAWISGAKRRIGFARDWRSWLLTETLVPKSRTTPNPVIDEYRRLAVQLGCSAEHRPIELAVTPRDQEQLNSFWNSVNHRAERGYVCLNTGGAFGKAKNWPRESFVKLATRIAHELNKDVLIVCGPSERDDARWIAKQSNHPQVHSLADVPLSIGLTKASIQEADLLVTTDSGPRHFAAAFGTPVITLFGPTHIAWSETNYDRAEHLQLKLDCGPCQQRECPLQDHRCMRDLTVETVFDSVQRQLERYSQNRRVA